MVALSEAYKETPLLRHHIVPIDFRSAGPELPDSHDWTHSPSADAADAGLSAAGALSGDRPSPPVIDLSDPDAAGLMRRACEDWGAFLLTGHGVPADALEAETRRLFGLPAERKLRALRSPGGATGYGVARISPFFSKHMWHEGFTIMGSPLDHAKELWPVGHDRFCEVMIDYQKQMKQLAEKILKLLLKSLNISDQHLDWLPAVDHDHDHDHDDQRPYGSSPCSALQLNSYPPCPDPSRAMGLAPHTDTFLLTVLHQTATGSGGGGLQVLSKGSWVAVPPVPGALVINVGDLLHVLSGGRLRSVVHRVAVNRTRQRYSAAYFYGPPMDFTVSPPPPLSLDAAAVGAGAGAEALPRYRSVEVKEFVEMRAKHLDKALSLIRID